MDTTPTARTDLTPTTVPWLAVGVYSVLACGLAWLVQLPLWLSGEGLASPLFGTLTAAMMFTPAVAALAVTFLIVRPSHKARYLGLVPFHPKRSIPLMIAWPIVFLALGMGAFWLAVALGWTGADTGLMGLAIQLAGEMSTTEYLQSRYLWLPLAVLASSVTAFGEELGWRGFLTTALAPLGFWRTALISGLVWGVWHAPIILLGYNFNRTDLSGVLLMCGFTLAVGVLLQWSRYWARNVWVAAVGHGALNAVTPLTLIWLTIASDTATATLLGVPGWIVVGVVVVIMLAVGAFRRLPRPLVPAPRTVTEA